MKKSQVSFFIAGILLLVLLFVLSGQRVPKSPILERTSSMQGDKAAIELFVSACVDDALEQGIDSIAYQGGFFVVQEPLVRFENFSVPFYLYKNQMHLPSQERMATELENYVLSQIAGCLRGLVLYREQGYEITIGTMEARIIFDLNRTRLDATLPMKFHKDDSFFLVSDFSSSVNADFAMMYMAIKKLMQEQERDLSGIPLGELAQLALQHDFYYHLWYLDDTTVLYDLTFRQQNDKNIAFNFAVQYDWDSEEMTNG